MRNVFLLVVLITTAITFLMPSSYTATTTVLVDVKSPDPISGLLAQSMVMPGYMETQVDIISSDRVARRVVKNLGLENVPELVESWRVDGQGKGTFEGFYAAQLGKKLDVKPGKESNVINIAYTGRNPKTVAAVANAFAQAYLDTNVELSVDPAKRYTAWFEERAKVVREKLGKAQAALSAYQTEKGIVSVDERLDVENQRLNDLSGQLTLLETQKSEAQSRQNGARNNADTNPDVINNPVVQNLRSTITAAEAKLQEASNELGANHPQIKQQKAELESLRARLKSEMSNVASSLGANTLVSIQKEAEVRGALEAQKTRVLGLKKQRDEVSVLEKDVEQAQHEYDGINQRLNQSSLESQNQQTNVAVLTPAYEPLDTSSPKIFLNIIVSIFLGAMLGIGSAIMLELYHDRLIRSEQDLSELGIPVLGALIMNIPARSKRQRSRWKFWRKQAAAY